MKNFGILCMLGAMALTVGCLTTAQPANTVHSEETANAVSDPEATPTGEILVGMTDTVRYFPLLRGKRIALLANHTSIASFDAEQEPTHLVDLLHRRGFQVTGIFSPEHGFRGSADAGEAVRNSTDPATGIPIRSLYNGKTTRPSKEDMQTFDCLVVDMQDVGLRFYTYHIAMLRLMDACAEERKKVVILDRPNPNGGHIQGPILENRFRSGVGILPVPVLHGLTMGEIARMAVGEGWAAPCDFEVIPCRNYNHSREYILPVAPSPNLRTQRAIYLYAALCPFEGTIVSVGRGTDTPFECFGHPNLAGYSYTFTPHSCAGAKHPPLEGQLCRGRDLSDMPLEEARSMGFDLHYVIEAYRACPDREHFFNPMFDKLIGTDEVRKKIIAGADESEISDLWDVKPYKVLREKYLLYPDE